MPPVKNAPRGRCAVCKRELALNIDGTLHAHRHRREPCAGSHRAPKTPQGARDGREAAA